MGALFAWERTGEWGRGRDDFDRSDLFSRAPACPSSNVSNTESPTPGCVRRSGAMGRARVWEANAFTSEGPTAQANGEVPGTLHVGAEGAKSRRCFTCGRRGRGGKCLGIEDGEVPKGEKMPTVGGAGTSFAQPPGRRCDAERNEGSAARRVFHMKQGRIPSYCSFGPVPRTVSGNDDRRWRRPYRAGS